MSAPMPEQNFLGVGARFPFQVDPRGWIALAPHEIDIEDSIRLILLTNHGERAMRPDFGANLGNQVFANMAETSLGAIQGAVMEALVQWEPRIKVIAVRVRADQRHDASLSVEVDYRVRSTNSMFNLVVPFARPEDGSL